MYEWHNVAAPILDMYIVTESFCPGGGIVWLITGKTLYRGPLGQPDSGPNRASPD